MRFDARAFVKACRLLGMTDEEIIEAVKKVRAEQAKNAEYKDDTQKEA